MFRAFISPSSGVSQAVVYMQLFTLEQFAWTVCKLVSYPDGYHDDDRKIWVMNSL
jgi:hypothetical protein